MAITFEYVDVKDVGLTIDKFVNEKKFDALESYLKPLQTFVNSCQEPLKYVLFYYIGTGYSELFNCYLQKNDHLRSREFKELSFKYFRESISLIEENNSLAASHVEVMIYINYGLGLLSCGRVIEAIRVLRIALIHNPEFGMAQANYGYSLNHYARLCNNANDRKILNHYANVYMKKALSLNDPNMYPEAREVFQKLSNEYDREVENYLNNLKRGKNLGRSKKEQLYRKWCLQNHLFLTPLNDLIEVDCCDATDPLTIAQCIDEIGVEPPRWFAMLNQLKEEYIYLRYLYFESLDSKKRPHFADKGVAIAFASYDYASYSIRLEQLKMCFKNLFSIFDQVAFVVNSYWNLGLKTDFVSASRVFKNPDRFQENFALMGLYWSYREFREKYANSSKAYEGDLKELRNALEHRFVKVTNSYQNSKSLIKNNNFDVIEEMLLRKYTLRLLQLTREWIINLVYAIHLEEKNKPFHSDKYLDIAVNDFPDNLKL